MVPALFCEDMYVSQAQKTSHVRLLTSNTLVARFLNYRWREAVQLKSMLVP
jgi:hypothetical protein